MSADPSWLPADFVHPVRVGMPGGLHLRPIRADDVDIDLPAVMGSRDRLWAIYGDAWGWPPATMTREQDHDDLLHHQREIEAHETFNYALLDENETELLGCVYLDPVNDGSADCEASWWVVDRLAGQPIETELDGAVREWIRQAWPFRRVRFAFGQADIA